MPATRTRPVTKPATSPVLLAHLTRLTAVATKAAPVTADVAESNAIYMARLEAQGLVTRVGTVQTGERGRPAVLFAPTEKGRKRAKRAAAKA